MKSYKWRWRVPVYMSMCKTGYGQYVFLVIYGFGVNATLICTEHQAIFPVLLLWFPLQSLRSSTNFPQRSAQGKWSCPFSSTQFKAFLGIWKHTNFVQQDCLFFHYFLASSMTNWVQIFTDLLFYVGIQQERILELWGCWIK